MKKSIKTEKTARLKQSLRRKTKPAKLVTKEFLKISQNLLKVKTGYFIPIAKQIRS